MKKNITSKSRLKRRHTSTEENPRKERWLKTCQWSMAQPIELLIEIMQKRIKTIDDYPHDDNGTINLRSTGVSNIDIDAIETTFKDRIKDNPINPIDKNEVELKIGDKVKFAELYANSTQEQIENPTYKEGILIGFESHKGSKERGKVTIQLEDNSNVFAFSSLALEKVI